MAKTAILSVRIVSDANDRGFKKAARDVQSFEVKAKKSLASATKSVASMAAKAGAAAVGISGLAAPIAAIGSAAASVAAPMAALGGAMAVPTIVGAGLAFGALSLAIKGVGDMINETDPAAFAEGLAEFPPAAQAAIISLREMKTEWQGMGDTIKEAFWGNLSNLGQLGTLMDPLRESMTRLAADMGNAAAGLVAFVSQGTGLQAVSTLMQEGSTATGLLSLALSDTLRGLIAVGAAASPILTDLAAKINEVAAAWADRMVAAFADGTLQQYFVDASARAGAFMDVMGQIGGIVGGVFSAMAAAGAPFLGSLTGIVAATHEWVTSAEGVATLNSFFAQSADTVATLVGAFGALAAAIAPLIGPITQITSLLADAFAGAIQALMPIIEQIVGILQSGLNAAFIALQPIIPVINAAFEQLSGALQPLMPAFQQLIDAVVALIPPIVQAASSVIPPLIDVLDAIMPVVTAVIEGFADFLEGLSPVIDIVGTLVGTALKPLAAILKFVAGAISPVIRLVTSMGFGFGSAIGVSGKLKSALNGVKSILGGVQRFFGRVADAVGNVVGAVGRLIGSLGRIRFPSPPSWLTRFFAEPMGPDYPDWDNIAFGQFAAGDTLGRLSTISANTGNSPTSINVTVNVSGMVTADKIELAETIKDALTTHSRVLGRTSAVGV